MKLGATFSAASLLTFFFTGVLMGHSAEPQPRPSLESLRQLHAAGNFKDAYEGFRVALAADDVSATTFAEDLGYAVHALERLNRIPEIDGLLENLAAVHKNRWRMLWAVGDRYLHIPHQGFRVAGKFERGPHRGGGEYVDAFMRDRVRAMQLLVQAMPGAQKDEDHGQAAMYYDVLARVLLEGRDGPGAWRLQILTDLTVLPDIETNPWRYGGGSPQGAPVDEAGNPIYYAVPKTFAEAKSDGERWRYCVAMSMELGPRSRLYSMLRYAGVLNQQFGVETLAQAGRRFGRGEIVEQAGRRFDPGAVDDTQEARTGIFALHTLKDEETIARLATGVKRFTLPDEHNPIKIYHDVMRQDRDGNAMEAAVRLAEIYTNRRQYVRAAEMWRKAIPLAEKHKNPSLVKNYKGRLDQIVGNWGRFEPTNVQPAGKGATLEYRFRNARSVRFTAHAILVDKLLADLKDYVKSRPRSLEWDRVNLGDLGYRLVEKNQTRYLGEKAAEWTLALEPQPGHVDRRVTVTTPMQKAGAYLVRAEAADGNTCFVVVWTADTVIAKKQLDGKTLYYVGDAVTGAPIPKADLEFFGFRQEHRDGNRFEITTKHFAEYADADGLVTTDENRQSHEYQWLITARTDEGRMAFLGFSGVWYGHRYDAGYNAVKAFVITDRPVYRPAQKASFKVWIRRAQYDREEPGEFAGREQMIRLHNPKGEKVLEKTFKADAYGGIEGTWEIPADAALGVYQVEAVNVGGSSFRVEEYKKPEYEVTVDSPSTPVMLGEKITAVVKAKYYFGSPVTKAKVKYKVSRSGYAQAWYPVCRWDWLYGAGYWWFAYDYDWYPGWKHWGFCRPHPFWFPVRHDPPEVVVDREVEIGPNGEVKIEIDTAVAKALHPDQDHQYSITAEVIDSSRRTIVGAGNVLVARKPFSVYAWVDRGYYRVGDTVEANFSARTLDGRPVRGPGKATLYKVAYRDGRPVETAVQTWELPTNEEGAASLQMKAAAAGQYRVALQVTDSKEHVIEGAYVFTVIGQGESGDYRFNQVELVPEKKEYQPGEKVRLLVNTDRADGTVLLFVRPTDGICPPPKVLRLRGKSTTVEIDVVKKDMPNFFIEAVTIAAGRVHAEMKEIVVPPEKRVLSVDVLPSAKEYRPGQKAAVKLKLTDAAGRPFVGSTVVAIYDKSVEYVSGGSNVPEIKAFFWKWRRHHRPYTESSLNRYGGNRYPPKAVGMSNLGIFGGTVADDEEVAVADRDYADGFNAGFGGMADGPTRSMMKFEGRTTGSAMPVPMAAPMMAAKAAAPAMEANAGAAVPQYGGLDPLQHAQVQPTVRKQFADTALWVGALTTAEDGTAEVSLNMPENLTTWRIKVWGMGRGTQVGEGSVDVVTRKDLIVRLQSPRFFVEKDEVVLSAVVHNYLKTEKKVTVVLELDGKCLERIGEGAKKDASVAIKPEGEARVDWRVKVVGEGEATVRMKALTDEESDAMEQKFPCYVHGMLKQEARSGAIRPEETSGKMTFKVPAERRPAQSRLEVRFSPTLAGAMVDALPYMTSYPYGCTEQTLNRFLPTVITQKILLDMRVDLDAVRKKQTNLNAQELGDEKERAAQWKRFQENPVFDRDEVSRMVKSGVQRLTEMQLSDGGWGWFSGWGEYSWPHTTAVVVHGLQVAKQCDVALVPGVLERGTEWLKKHQDSQVVRLKNALKEPKVEPWKTQADNLDALVYMVLVDGGVKNAEMHEFLYRDRTHLSAYALAMYGLAVEKLGDREKLDMVMKNLSQYLVEDQENQTAWLNLGEGNPWWCWYGSEIEADAYYLKLLAKTDPKGETARRLVKYLLNNRKHATYWNSTRDSALCIEAMADFLRASGEASPEMTVEVWFDGKLQKAVEITPAVLFGFDNKFVLEGAAIADGEHVVELKKKGRGPLYFNGYLTNFTLEDPIAKTGLEVKVERKYYRLKKVDAGTKVAGSRGQVVDQKVEKYERIPLADGAKLRSGDLVEIELEIASKNDYEYLCFEDMKPAGFEPVEVQSGYNGNAMGAYVEFRDAKVVFFVRQLARGNHSVSYRMRAETPGLFHALPTKAAAMYAPELKANSDEIRLGVTD